jgi:hypothetical protein
MSIDWGFLAALAVLAGGAFYLGRLYERAKEQEPRKP